MSEIFRSGFFNALATKDLSRTAIEKRVSFISAAVEQYGLDTIGVTECQVNLAIALAGKGFATFDYDPVIDDRRTGLEGMLLLAPQIQRKDLSITRQLSWVGEPIRNKLRTDGRQLVRYAFQHGGENKAGFYKHRFHPHHIPYPEFLETAYLQDEHIIRVLQEEPLPYILQEDSNIAFEDEYRIRYNPHLTGAYVLSHIGGATWRPDHKPVRALERALRATVPPFLKLDRGIVRQDIARKATLMTVPNQIGRIKNPSDHSMTILQLAA